MSTIDAVNNFKTRHITAATIEQQQKQKETKEKAATVVGSTGFVATATKYASKRGLSASAQAGEKTLQSMMEATQKASRITGKGIKESTGFIAKFKKNMKLFSGDFMKFTKGLENTKFIGPIVKSPLIKKAAGAFGGVMAFFVLVTGLSKAAETGALAFDDAKDKYRQIRSY